MINLAHLHITKIFPSLFGNLPVKEGEWRYMLDIGEWRVTRSVEEATRGWVKVQGRVHGQRFGFGTDGLADVEGAAIGVLEGGSDPAAPSLMSFHQVP